MLGIYLVRILSQPTLLFLYLTHEAPKFKKLNGRYVNLDFNSLCGAALKRKRHDGLKQLSRHFEFLLAL